MGLWDAAMIKDNHVAVAGGVAGGRPRRAAGVASIICEVDRLDQIAPALAAGATHLLLDNMGPDMLRAPWRWWLAACPARPAAGYGSTHRRDCGIGRGLCVGRAPDKARRRPISALIFGALNCA
jgi:hypothetical protein